MFGDILIAVIFVFLIWLTLKVKKKGGRIMLFDKDREFYSAGVMESPLDLTERSIVTKRDRDWWNNSFGVRRKTNFAY